MDIPAALQLRLSVLEMHNEIIRDLLADYDGEIIDVDNEDEDDDFNTNKKSSRATTSSDSNQLDTESGRDRGRDSSGMITGTNGRLSSPVTADSKLLEVRLVKNEVVVEGLSEWTVESAEQMEHILDRAVLNRGAGAVGSGDRSGNEQVEVEEGDIEEHNKRSHFVIMLKVDSPLLLCIKFAFWNPKNEYAFVRTPNLSSYHFHVNSLIFPPSYCFISGVSHRHHYWEDNTGVFVSGGSGWVRAAQAICCCQREEPENDPACEQVHSSK
jgi:hypothetical protein